MNIISVKKKYSKDQFCLYKNFFSKKDFKILDKVFRAFLKKFFHYKTNSQQFIFHNQKMHDFLLRKKKNNIYFFSKIYNTLQASSAIHSFLNSKKILKVASELIGCRPEQLISTSYQLRIDVPSDKKNRLDWHYDLYKYRTKIKFNKKSGIVFWIPLQDVNRNNGTIEYLKKSYKIKNGSKGVQGDDKAFKINQSLVDRFGTERVDANFGDMFIQSYLMLHQSGFNTSNKIRFSLIGRYINIGEKSFKGCKKSMELLDLY